MGNFAENLNLGNRFRPPLFYTIDYHAATILEFKQGLGS